MTYEESLRDLYLGLLWKRADAQENGATEQQMDDIEDEIWEVEASADRESIDLGSVHVTFEAAQALAAEDDPRLLFDDREADTALACNRIANLCYYVREMA